MLSASDARYSACLWVMCNASAISRFVRPWRIRATASCSSLPLGCRSQYFGALFLCFSTIGALHRAQVLTGRCLGSRCAGADRRDKQPVDRTSKPDFYLGVFR